MYTFDENIVSDLHKDAYGFRPTSGWWDCWHYQDNDGKQAAWNTLLDDLERSIAQQQAAEASAEIEFHQRIQGAMLIGAADEVTAIRWILEAEEFTEYDLAYGKSYVAWHFGLSYQNQFQDQIDEAIKQMEKA